MTVSEKKPATAGQLAIDDVYGESEVDTRARPWEEAVANLKECELEGEDIVETSSIDMAMTVSA